MTTQDRVPWPLKAILIALAIGILFAAQTEKSNALEAGATFDGAICWEADGTEGITTIDGSCMTPADYDVIFGYENLSLIDSRALPGIDVATLYGITPDSQAASERPRIFGGVHLETFVVVVRTTHGWLLIS